jgi:alpha-methylacyl-CoA racemase
LAGPLHGIRVVELVGIGPGPFAAMMLADLGAEVIRVDRAGSVRPGREASPYDVMGRSRQSIGVDLKSPEGVEVVLRLVESADVLTEGFRPGVTERLGVGPDVCLARNPKLVYGRMTGWGQEGPYARSAGHDINYISLSGSLSLIGRAGERPVPPVNFLGDFGGGGMLLALGVVAAVVEAQRSGQGQVVDAAMVDGAALVAAMAWGVVGSGSWGPRGTNLLDTGAWYYDVYECADGKYVSLGSLEPQFYAQMLELTGLEADIDGRGPLPDPTDKATWPAMKDRMAALMGTKTRDEWCAIMEGTDVCFAPVLEVAEASKHPHNQHRGTFVDVAGVVQPGPAPRFSRTVAETPTPPVAPGAQTDRILSGVGYSPEEISGLRGGGAVA